MHRGASEHAEGAEDAESYLMQKLKTGYMNTKLNLVGRFLIKTLFLLPVVLLAFPGTQASAQNHSVTKLSAKDAAEYKLDKKFYGKTTWVEDILIASSDKVSDHAHLEAAYQFEMIMKSIDKNVADRIREKKVLCILIGHNELTSELPQFGSDKKGKELDFYNWRNRGFLTHKLGRPTVVFAEEDVLEFEGGMQLESILIHEFGHVIDGAGFNDAQKQLLDAAFKRAKEQGIWMDGRAAQRFRRIKSKQPISLLEELTKAFPDQSPQLLKKCIDAGDILVNGQRTNSRALVTKLDKVLIQFGGPKECYAHKNRAEYWAEGVQSWYNTNRTMDHDHNHIHTRKQLKEYDPPLAKLCESVLGDTPWRFVSPRDRAGKGHLVGFDPANSPKVVDPPHIEIAALDYYDEYWKTYWQRLSDKHALVPKLVAEDLKKLVLDVETKGNSIRGSIIFAEKRTRCATCHFAENQKSIGPNIASTGERATVEHLIESVLYPSRKIEKEFETLIVETVDGITLSGRKIEDSNTSITLRDPIDLAKTYKILKEDIESQTSSKKSAMPEGIGNELASRQEFLDVIKYMAELAKSAPDIAMTPKFEIPENRLTDDIRGFELISKWNCNSCHVLSPNQKPKMLSKNGPKLDGVNGMLRAKYVQAFIANPAKTKVGTTMPSVVHHLPEDQKTEVAQSLTHYVYSLSRTKMQTKVWSRKKDDIQSGESLFHSLGCVACHSSRSSDGKEIADSISVPMGDVAAKYTHDGLIKFLKDPHVSRPNGRMPNMKLTHFEASDIAMFLMQNAASRDLAFDWNSELAKKGRQHFQSLGCANCHEVPNYLLSRKIPIAEVSNGCLGEVGKKEIPKFEITEQERTQLVSAIKRQSEIGKNPLSQQEQINLSLLNFNCVACHTRGSLGGIHPDKDYHFQTSNENLGEQGRIPPTLTNVGAKLKSKWMRDVLVNGKVIRPYMKTRMPQFGVENVQPLIELFAETDKLPEINLPPVKDQKKAKEAGHELVGKTGLNCIACHNFQQKPAETMPAVDLTEMSLRLKKDWFHHYMKSPQSFSLNTVMPSFWPGGKSMRKEILQGDSDLQIQALWTYLLDDREARTPRGLQRKPMELVAVDEAVMLRRSYPGIGKRGIGVGLPGNVNFVFNAEQIQLAMLWEGKFADPSGVFRSQGHGTVRPLSRNVIRLGKGPELDDRTNPFSPKVPDQKVAAPAASDVQIRPPNHQFKGYYLDELQRPTFMYRFENVDVEDYLVNVSQSKGSQSGSGISFIRRTITFSTKTDRDNLRFRIAVGKVEKAGDQEYRFGDNLKIKIIGDFKAVIKGTGNESELLVPFELRGKSQLQIEYHWIKK